MAEKKENDDKSAAKAAVQVHKFSTQSKIEKIKQNVARLNTIFKEADEILKQTFDFEG